MKPASYYSPDGDLVYISVRPSDHVRTEEHEWGLLDYDTGSGALTGIEIWEASKKLPDELVEALPHLGRSNVAVTREELAGHQPA